MILFLVIQMEQLQSSGVLMGCQSLFWYIKIRLLKNKCDTYQVDDISDEILKSLST